jgi:hypothetical protein
MTKSLPSILSVLILGIVTLSAHAGVPREHCFEINRIPPSLHARARQILLQALDEEGLYTLVSRLKPISSGVITLTRNVGQTEYPPELQELRAMLPAFQCGSELHAWLHTYPQVYENQEVTDLYIGSPELIQKKWSESLELQSLLQDSTLQNPAQLLNTVDRMQRYDRFLSFGMFFGYPRAAIDFFVAAARHQDLTGEFVARDFRFAPVHSQSSGAFVWAVPKGSYETAEESALIQKAQTVLHHYRERRAAAIRALHPEDRKDSPPSFEILQGWYCEHSSIDCRRPTPEISASTL